MSTAAVSIPKTTPSALVKDAPVALTLVSGKQATDAATILAAFQAGAQGKSLGEMQAAAALTNAAATAATADPVVPTFLSLKTQVMSVFENNYNVAQGYASDMLNAMKLSSGKIAALRAQVVTYNNANALLQSTDTAFATNNVQIGKLSGQIDQLMADNSIATIRLTDMMQKADRALTTYSSFMEELNRVAMSIAQKA